MATGPNESDDQPEEADEVDILDIDNTAVREAQIVRLNAVKRARDETRCGGTLEACLRNTMGARGCKLKPGNATSESAGCGAGVS